MSYGAPCSVTSPGAALLDALAEEASATLRTAVAAGAERAEAESAERVLAHLVFSMWPVGDRYRLLLALVKRDLGAERVAEMLAPAREAATAVLERGQQDGVFHTLLPAAVLSAGLEAMTVALLEAVNTGALEDDGGARVAAATLIAAGVSEERSRAVVEDVASTVVGETAADG